jgi:tetratricopeptide (TPR) repeat protein
LPYGLHSPHTDFFGPDQGLQFLAEAFDWSSRVLQFGTLIALIGLPIVLVLAWYHGDRGHQRPLRTEIAILALLLLAGGHLWAETYDRPATDVLAVQDDIAKRVTEALSVALAGKSGPGSIGTTNDAAYDAYLRGKQLVESRETTAIREGVALLEKSVAADPNLARGWVELSAAYEGAARVSGGNPWGYMPEEQAMPLSKRAAMRAVEVGPEFGLAHSRLARTLRQFREAIRLKPDNAVPYLWAAITTEPSLDRADVSLRLYRHAASLDGENATVFSNLSLLYRRLGEEQLALRAERELQRLRATDDLQWSRAYLATVAERPLEARLLLEQIRRVRLRTLRR